MLLRHPGVRDRIEQHAAAAPRARRSAEDFLADVDRFLPAPVQAQWIGGWVHPWACRLGVRTGKERHEALSIPVGRAIVRVLCSLARNGHPIRAVVQQEDGVVIDAVLPSDLWSWEGDLIVSVCHAGSGTRVDAAARVQGQVFDWGKCRRCLDALFAGLRRDLETVGSAPKGARS